VCPRERLVIISYTTVLSFALERIGPLAAIITTVFYLLAFYLSALPNTPENPFASIYSETLIKTTCQHLLLLVGFDTLIYRKYYDTPPILVGHQWPACQIYISKWYIIMEEDNQGGVPWTLRYASGMMEIMPWPTRWRSNAWRTISYHIIYACDVYPFMHLIFLRFDSAVAL
jgi:hypothetical protein